MNLIKECNKLIEISTLKDITVELPSLLLSNGSVYKGKWMNEKRHGYGELNWPDGSFY